MLRSSKFIFLLLIGGVFGSVNVKAQTLVDWKDFQLIKQYEGWLTSYNAAGLQVLPIERISIAEVGIIKDNGSFTNSYQSSNSFTFNALTESFYRLNNRTVLYGKVSYDNFSGKNMGGSVLIDPYYHSFDIIEYDDNTKGNKELETYNLIGSISSKVYKQLTLGGKVNFTAANYAKQKDLRHKNKLLDIDVTAGASYNWGRVVDIGANYYYKRSVEGLELSREGTTDKDYFTLINYGAFFGKMEQFGANSYFKENEERPIFNEYHGISLQINLNLNQFLTFFNEFTYKSRDGYYGKRSSTSVVYSEHNSNIWEYNGVFSLQQKRNLHLLKVNLTTEQLNNYENIFKSEAKPTGSGTQINYYGQLETTNRQITHAIIEYTGNLLVDNFNPVWTIKGGVELFHRKQTASLYPYYRKQTLRYTDFFAQVNRNIVKNRNMYTISISGSYHSGSGDPFYDRLYVPPSEDQTPPKSTDEYLYREYEYLTDNRFSGDISFKYSRLFDKVNMKGYASVGYKFTKASDIEYLQGDKHHQFRMTVGCTF